MPYYGYPLASVTPQGANQLLSINSNTVLGVGAATYDKQFLISGAGGYVVTLPAIDATNFSARTFTIFNGSSAACTVNTSGSDTALLLGSSYTSMSILPGERFLVQNMSVSWVIGLESPSRTTTASQFDNTIRAASTAFVQKALGNNQTAIQSTTTSSLVLTAAQAGSAYQVNGPVTLPLVSTCPLGATFSITNASTNAITLTPSGSDKLALGGVTLTTLSLGSNDTVTFSCMGVVSGYPSWLCTSGSAILPYSSLFGSSLATGGYQKLPSGLIVQWGNGAIAGQTVGATLTFPIAFPTALASIVGALGSTISGTNNVTGIGIQSNGTKTGFSVTICSNSTTVTGFQWVAFGY